MDQHRQAVQRSQARPLGIVEEASTRRIVNEVDDGPMWRQQFAWQCGFIGPKADRGRFDDQLAFLRVVPTDGAQRPGLDIRLGEAGFQVSG